MAINKCLILEVYPYEYELGAIHSGDIVFKVKDIDLELVGFSIDIDLIKYAMQNIGKYIEMDISIDISKGMKKIDEKKKTIELLKKEPRQSKFMPSDCEYGIIGKIVSMIYLDLSNGNKEYYSRIDCGCLVDYPLSKSEIMKFETGEYKIGDYVMVELTKFDVNLPNMYDYKIVVYK
ncbi:hypothetical protein [Methanococcus aeolicus]|uniref:Uncharacterized protein n=1 Tax=Methanococcus aeolicus (strain ATCC BAA-1280 / DSM 17508 / OCM 812 / Nankai-3) TaxID=419665 RepID=A6UU61_META3|nr:hypothetical protein [Methanococcus aeolicus]ABR56033.1 hypothetical protein Maeo_0447 [Methanococcus aeolicus Nankai-3]UXM85362.1 hypothetical protein N6C89_03550 [Methanococcus aeolicus]